MNLDEFISALKSIANYINQSKLENVLYFRDAVIDELKDISVITNSILNTGGLKIYTTLDVDAQSALENAVKNNMDGNTDIQVAGAMMNPNDGGVMAMIGGTDYATSQFNRVIDAKRQVGSTMKPILYYSALENGFTSSSCFTSEKTTFNFSTGKSYTPNNYNDKYADGAITMGAAISYSDNIYAVKTHLFLGEDTLVNLLKRVGVSSELEAIPSLALGTEEISLVDMMQAYGTLASMGYKNKPYLIEKVLDSDGNVLYEHESNSELVLNQSDVFILNELLTGTYSSDFIDYNYPTLISFSGKLTHKYSIKTGTTDTDRLIFGYNNNLLIGVWTGYDDNSESPSEDSSISKDIWFNTMEGCMDGKEDSWYSIPNNIVGVLVDPIDGELAGDSTGHKHMFYYIKGTEPTLTDSNLDGLIPTMKYEE